MASVFLSYSREDVERIRPLAAALEKIGHDVWWDRHIAGGEEFSGAIEQALESAEVVVVAWTASSVKSAWVRDEAAAGRDRSCLVPVTLDGCAPPLGFRQYQTVDLSKWNGREGSAALVPLAEAIEKSCGRPAPSRGTRPVRSSPWVERLRSWQAAVAAAFLLVAMLGVGVIYPRMAASGPI